MNRLIFLSSILLAPAAATAQTAVAQPPLPADAPALRQITLPPNTEVVVTPNDTVTTKGKKVKEGYKFRMSTVLDVMQEGYVVIPKGTMGEGTVT